MQYAPAPEREFAEDTFKTEISLDKSLKSRTDRDGVVQEIAKWISALMNTSGGLILLYSNTPDSDKDRDNWIQSFEHFIDYWIPESLIRPVVRYKFLELDGKVRIYIFVCRSRNLVTFDFHAYSRLAASVRKLYANDYPMVQELLNESGSSPRGLPCQSQMKTLLQEREAFTVDELLPVTHSESETMEFKHFFTNVESKRVELCWFEADELTSRLEKYMKCLCAFANTQGGSFVVGVKEETKSPVIRGFSVIQNQEKEQQKVTDYLTRKLGKCIWHGDPDYKPEKGKDWDVLYHKVIGEDETERRLIEICIAKHSGGMYLQSPEYYVVDWKDGICEATRKVDIKHWKKLFLACAGRNDTRTDLRKHIDTNREFAEMDYQEDQDNHGPEVQPQPVTAEVAAESKLPKSFKESHSEHKSDIVVQPLKRHDCCTDRMAKYITTLLPESNKMQWYPSMEYIQKRFPSKAYGDRLVTFLQNKAWTGLASVIGIDQQESDTTKIPQGHSLICHILKISKAQDPLLMFCIASKEQSQLTEQVLSGLVCYALDVGRVLKRDFLMSALNQKYECLFHFDIEVVLVPDKGDVSTVWDSKNVQPVTYPRGSQEQQFDIACNGLSKDLLRTRALLKDRYGQILTEHLTEEQAKVLHDQRKRVLITHGKSGTGKTVVALNLAMEAMGQGSGQQEVVYICRSKGLKSFVSYQLSLLDDQVILLKSTSDSLSPSQKSNLEKARLIVVDDVHAIELDKHCRYWRSDSLGADNVDAMEIDEHMETKPDDIYRMLFKCATKPNTRVAIFFDPEQDYKGNLPADFDKKLRHLAETQCDVSTEDIMIMPLRERIRNSQEINRFMQANQNLAKISDTIECLNESPGDDVIYQYIGSKGEESAKILNDKLGRLTAKYEPGSIAILCDDDEQMEATKTHLIRRHNRTFHDPNKYPIQNVVISNLEDFVGLEAEVVLFVLPRNFGKEKIKVYWKYINVISSRARERLEFLLPWKPESEEEKQRESLMNLLELFKNVYYVSSNSL